MQRREFLTSAGAAAALGTTLSTASGRETVAPREFIELRTYTVDGPAKRALLVRLLDKALVPALNAQGIRPVGVFQPRPELGKGEEAFANKVFVVIPHKTLDSHVTLNAKLSADETFRKNAAPIFAAGSKDAVYTNCEGQLLYAFPTAPTLETPALGKDRVFQLRLYRSCNLDRNAAKIHMFEQGGELAAFRKVGLNPIFFGEALSGKKMPNLTYMIGCENQAAHDAAWKTFVSHPDWLKIKDLPEYADTATEIERVVLLPSPGSQI